MRTGQAALALTLRLAGCDDGSPAADPEVDAVVTDAAQAPLRGNVALGTATGGLFQHDRVRPYSGGSRQRAGHNDVVSGREGGYQMQRFLETWLADGVAEIVDPCDLLGRP